MTEVFKPTYLIEQYCIVLEPEKSEPPILDPEIRDSILEWIAEIGAEEELAAVGIKPRRTTMLEGPPGCGKTTLAHHLAARLGLHLVIMDISRTLSSFVSGTAQRIGEIFREVAEQSESCVFFLDEFDSVARTRGEHNSTNSQDQAVTVLLQQIDRYTGLLMAATNRAADIDPAVYRRFDIHLTIKEPNDAARFAIIKRYLSPMVVDDETIHALVHHTAGASPALLKKLMENIKRSLVLRPRYGRPVDAHSIIRSVVLSCHPHAKATVPALWSSKEARAAFKGVPWPPVLPAKNDVSGAAA